MVFIEPFDRLLNSISHELDEQNLRSLIHICGYYIGGRDREQIKDGLDLFRILRQNGVLNEDRDKIANLLEIIKEMRPKRQDLVDKVKEFIRETVEAPDTILVVDSESLEPSGDYGGGLRLIKENGSATPLLVSSDSRFCAINCCCCSCNCYSRNCSPYVCGTFAVVFIFLGIVAAIAWYGDIPRVTMHLNEDEDRRDAGKYAVGLLVFTGLLFIVGACLKHKLQGRMANSYSTFDQPNMAPSGASLFDRKSIQRTDSRSTASSRSWPKHASRKYHRDGSKASSVASTVSSSIFPASASSAARTSNKLPVDVVPDGDTMAPGMAASSTSSSLNSELMFPEDQEAAEGLSAERFAAGTTNHILYDA